VQNHFAAQVVAHFDVFLVLMRGVVDVVIALRFEEEVSGLTADHGDEPADQGGHHRVLEHHHVGDDETQCAQEMQGLIDAAVVVETMIVPTLGPQFCQKALHRWSSIEFRGSAMKQI
jgi:hypothetical protein